MRLFFFEEVQTTNLRKSNAGQTASTHYALTLECVDHKLMQQNQLDSHTNKRQQGVHWNAQFPLMLATIIKDIENLKKKENWKDQPCQSQKESNNA